MKLVMISAFKYKIKSAFQLNRIKRRQRKDNKDDGISVDQVLFLDGKGEGELFGCVTIILTISFFLIMAFLWAYLSKIDEVSKGQGRVIPISKEQAIQSLDGGVLTSINVQEGQVVDMGDVLAQLDIVRTESTVDETEAKYHSLLAKYSRLDAEVNNKKLLFPAVIHNEERLIESEKRLFYSRKKQFDESISNILESRRLISNELSINSRLVSDGAASKVDVIRLKKQLVDLNMKESQLKSDYFVNSREEMLKVASEMKSLAHSLRGRKDALSMLTIKSPVKGIVKNIEVNTIGGVISPNGVIMHIVPLDDTLLIEAQFSPRDIAFIHPNQKAIIKITAYDYAIYGGLDGEVVSISPDTISDERNADLVYYRVYIRTKENQISNDMNKPLLISPGMIAEVDIVTGNKTVLQYLIKPFNKVNEALRER
jgi:adhesin transport system membrane fusion protein